MCTSEVVLKTAQETAESGGISRNHREIWGILGKIQGEFRGNWGKIGELCFPNRKTEFPGGEIDFPNVGEKGGE